MIEVLATVTVWQWLFYGSIIFAAGFIRGLTGFGFSALCFFALGLFLSPKLIVPLVFMLEIAASIRLLPRVYAQIPWRWLAIVASSACIGVPVGIFLLHYLPPMTVRQSMGYLVLFACLFLLCIPASAQRITTTPSRLRSLFNSSFVLLGVGGLSGVANGIAAVGGMVVAVYSLATPLKMAQLRAGLIVFFLIIDLFGIIWLLLSQSPGAIAIPMSLLILTALSFPVMMLGNHFGFRYFDLIPESTKRNISLGLLTCFAALAAFA